MLFRKNLAVLASFFAIMSITPSLANASVGTGIGISFPVRSSSAGNSGHRTAYAAFSYDSIAQELTVEERKGGLRLELKITNAGDQDYSIPHHDGQEYDFTILDRNGKTLYRWSDNMNFTQALTTSTIAAHSQQVYTAEVDRKTWNRIQDDAAVITANLTDTSYHLTTRLPQKSKQSTPVVLHGGIILGNGQWMYDR